MGILAGEMRAAAGGWCSVPFTQTPSSPPLDQRDNLIIILCILLKLYSISTFELKKKTSCPTATYKHVQLQLSVRVQQVFWILWTEL